MRRRSHLALVAAIVLAVTAPSADAFTVHGRRWPHGLITYYDAAPDQAWALARAVSAWNGSGANLRFVATSRSRADVIVEHGKNPAIASCRRAVATVGRVRHARVFIFARNDGSLYCNRFNAAFFLTHELGHVLGLAHELRVCATMNPSGNMSGGEFCPNRQPWQWFCRLVEPDDVAGAIALYGGVARPEPGSGMCPLYTSQGPPDVHLEWLAAERAVRMSVQGSTAPAYAPFLRAETSGHAAGFGFAEASGSCPNGAALASRPDDAFQAGDRWDGVIAADPSPGRYCYVFWSVDALGRRSATTARRIIVVPPRATG